MAFQDLRRTPVTYQSQTCELAPHAKSKVGTWQRVALEFVGTFFVLMGIAIGILALRFALVMMHGWLH